MIIFATIMYTFLYAIAGMLIGFICAVILDEHPNFFGRAFSNQPSDNQIVLLMSFWPIFLIYVIVWCIIWYTKHLYISISGFIKSFIKIEK